MTQSEHRCAAALIVFIDVDASHSQTQGIGDDRMPGFVARRRLGILLCHQSSPLLAALIFSSARLTRHRLARLDVTHVSPRCTGFGLQVRCRLDRYILAVAVDSQGPVDRDLKPSAGVNQRTCLARRPFAA